MQTLGFKYVCMFCADTIAEYRDVWSDRPVVESVCDRPECRAEASDRYRRALTQVPPPLPRTTA